MAYTVTVARMGERARQGADVTLEAEGVRIADDGSLSVSCPEGHGRTFGAGTWASVKVTRNRGQG